MGACMSHRVEYPNDIHPNIFTVAIIGRVPTSRTLTSQTNNNNNNNNGRRSSARHSSSLRWSFLRVTATHRNSEGGQSSSSSYGQLEVTPSNLIYHRKGHEPVSWPLHFVRRYGYENNVFSFESGRRCQWQGVFTFRCRKAHQLFIAVQTRAQDQSNNDDSQRIVTSIPRPTSAEQYLRTSLTDENMDINRVSDCIISSCQRLSSRASQTTDDDESETNSQVFVEVTPSTCPSSTATYRPPDAQNEDLMCTNGQIRRRSALDSVGSSKSNSTLPLICDQPRPRSADQLALHFEKLSRNGTQVIIDFGDTELPRSTPVKAYYINVDTTKPVRKPSLRGASSSLCVNQAPRLRTSRTRSVSSDSKVQAQCRNSFCDQDQQTSDNNNHCSIIGQICPQGKSVRNYVNFSQLSAEPLAVLDEALNYMAVDLTDGNSSRISTPRTIVEQVEDPWSPFGLGTQEVKGHLRKTSATSASSHFFNGSSDARTQNNFSANTNHNTSGNTNFNNSNNNANFLVTNYVQIDCTKTKALKATAVQHRQMVHNGTNSSSHVPPRPRIQSAQIDAGQPSQATDGKKSTNSYTDGMPVRRNKRDCKLKHN